jgi:translation initiation factor 2B subunit (eIF-2B alpha/beta/delta family)
MKTTSIDFSSFVVLSNGSVDVQATVESFRTQLETYVSSQTNTVETVHNALNQLFDAHPKTLSLPFVVQTVLGSLEVTPENCKALTKQVQDIIKASSSKVRDGSLLRVEVGRGGGVSRWSDVQETK